MPPASTKQPANMLLLVVILAFVQFLDTVMVFSFEQFWNMLLVLMLVACLVSNLVRFSEVRFVMPENMLDMLVTCTVVNVAGRSSEVSPLQPWNMEAMEVRSGLPVLKDDRVSDVRPEQPWNMLVMLVTPVVTKLFRLRVPRPMQS